MLSVQVNFVFRNCQKLILASASPRRSQYLRDLGLEFTVCISQIDERILVGEEPQSFVQRLAREKAAAVSAKYPDSWVLAADTVISFDGRILGKPKDAEDAVSMLMLLAGKEHCVLTGFCLASQEKDVYHIRVVQTGVVFSQFSEEIARTYVATGEPFDKAGSYGIQSKGAFLARTITGSYSNVVGLPLAELIELLEECHVIEPACGHALCCFALG